MAEELTVSSVEVLNTPVPYEHVYDIGVEDHHNFFVLPEGGSRPIKYSNCHQLTPQAFQAILVSLESPPPAVSYTHLTLPTIYSV